MSGPRAAAPPRRDWSVWPVWLAAGVVGAAAWGGRAEPPMRVPSTSLTDAAKTIGWSGAGGAGVWRRLGVRVSNTWSAGCGRELLPQTGQTATPEEEPNRSSQSWP